MAYSPNYTQRPGFVKACANRKRFVTDIIRAIKDPEDYKTLFQFLFPTKPTPNVTLPSGYKQVLKGSLMDTSSISDTQIETIRTQLMSELQKDDSNLSLSLEPENRTRLQKVVMVTAPGWFSTFKEQFSSDSSVDKLPLPHQNALILKGPLTFMLMLLGLMIVSLVVRIMMSQVAGFSDSQALKMAIPDPTYGKNSYKTFPTGPTSDAQTGMMAQKLFNNNVYDPSVVASYAVIPGFLLSTLIQVGCLLLYIALLPFVLVFSNISKMFGMRNMQFIETVESVVFSQNAGYQSIPRFSNIDQRNFLGELQKTFDFGKYYKLNDLTTAMNNVVSRSNFNRLKVLLKDNKLDEFVKNNLQRFMSRNDDGLYMITQDSVEQAMDAYNLLNFSNSEDMWKILFKSPNFLSAIMRQSFSYPILVKVANDDLHYKIIPEYFWEKSTYKYLEIPAQFPDDRVPKLTFRVQRSSVTGNETVEQVSLRFTAGSGIKLVDKMDAVQTENVVQYGAGRTVQNTNVPKYLLVRDTEKTNPNQIGPNYMATFTRSIGMFSGTIGSGALVLMILFGIVSLLESMMGNYVHYNPNMFQKMTIVTSDAYYNWIRKPEVSKTDVAKFNLFVTRTNNRIKLVDVSGLTSDSKKIEELIDTYNKDVASTTFVRNQLFMRSLYLMFWMTLPFVAAWVFGVFNTRATFNILGTKGLNSLGDLRAWLPLMTIGVSLITLVTAGIQMGSSWYTQGGKKASLWRTVSETPRDRPHAPMKEAQETPDKLKTHSFLTTSGAELGSSLDRADQQHRRINTENMYNIKAFERTRVIFITDADDLQGYYLNHIHSNVRHHHMDTGVGEQMKTDDNYSYAMMLIFGTIISVFVIGGVLVGAEFVKTPGQTGSGVDAMQSNILKSGMAFTDMLFKYVGVVDSSTTLIGQIGVFILSLFVLVYTNVAPDSEIVAGHGSGKGVKSTELAYGSLAYIEHDAQPVSDSTQTQDELFRWDARFLLSHSFQEKEYKTLCHKRVLPEIYG